MKKRYAEILVQTTASALALALTLTACGNADPADPSANDPANKPANVHVSAPEVKEKTVRTVEDVSCFDYGEDGSLYSIFTRESGEYNIFPAQNPGEEDIKIPIYEAVLRITDISGEEKQSFVFDQQTMNTTLEYSDGAVYFTASEYIGNIETSVLKKYVFGETEPELLHYFNELESIEKTALVDGIIYILGVDPSNSGKNVSTNDFYVNRGEKILAYDIAKDKVTVVMEIGALDMSDTPRGTLMIYAHDNGGYYFIEYDRNGNFSEKQYTKNELTSFTVCGDDKYIYSDVRTNAAVASFNDTGIADIPIDDYIAGNVKFFSSGRLGYVFWGQSEKDNTYVNILKDIDISEFLSSDLSKKISMISADYFADTPLSLGYSVEQEEVGYDNFALTVLSQDPKYDIYMLYSRSDFAENIKSKGSFYPLNEVEGVREYIDSCFPGIRSAAINEDGDIWMLPIAISVPALAYSDSLETNASDLTAEKLVSLITDMYKDNEKAERLGSFNAYFLSELMLSNYLFGSTDLDTEEFRSLAEYIKENIFASKAFSETSSGMNKAMLTGDYSKIDIMMTTDSSMHTLASASGLSVTDFPMPTENPVPSTCAFICLNPASKNLEQALSYISALAKSLTEDAESLMRENSPKFTENEYYEGLKEVYKNTDVRFSYSGEIVLSDFYGYLEGKTTLDAFISEANRKLSAYLNE